MKLLLFFFLSLPMISMSQDFDLIYGNPAKEKVLKLDFVNPKDSSSSVIRIDHVGVGKGLFIPIIFSEQELIREENDLRFISVVLDSIELKEIVSFIKNKSTKISSYSGVENGVLRITYRESEIISQFFILNKKKSKRFLNDLEQQVSKQSKFEYVMELRRFRSNINL